ncbi:MULTISPECIES: hypothetical protein [Sphingobium]|uniref:DUF4276 family protein n=1 Tax=Sphingobium cupriresistens TaxID=1132417 RepID=A0A8G1ZFG1_9SPHN|nr:MULTISPECIES: hypothetical protein [Sphingobium]MBJ7377505.1 hypothetical protein [Sphingobium sp.]RYM08227.1 hypothetical protein EWH12_17225 [Sphingobium cupriresistens]
MYLSWSAFYEGKSDAQYFNVIIPRLLDDIIRISGKRPCDIGEFPALEFGIGDRSFDKVAAEICQRKNEFHIIFVHADLGGRGLAANVAQRREQLIQKAQEICDFNAQIAVMLSPEKEVEAWALADLTAIKAALGVNEISHHLVPDTPLAAERLLDPKASLEAIIRSVTNRRSTARNILVRIAQEQSIDQLRRANSFKMFEVSLRNALTHAGFLE